MLGSPPLTVGLRHGDAGAVRDQQVHHRVAGHVHGRRRHHAAEGHGAGGGHAGVDRAGHHGGLAARVGAHVALQLRGRLAVDAAQVADEHAARGRAAEAAGAVLPLLAVVLLGVDAQVRQRGEAWWRRCEDSVRGKSKVYLVFVCFIQKPLANQVKEDHINAKCFLK